MDRHLNLFYSYNRDNELIENNLTRAWIVTLGLLSPSVRHQFLSQLFNVITPEGSSLHTLQGIDFGDASLALQDNMEKKVSRRASTRVVLAIASYRYEYSLVKIDLFLDPYLSKPDAWIFDPDGSYCLLIEAKVGSNPLNDRQLVSHANDWFNIKQRDLGSYLLPLDWCDVVEVVRKLQDQDIGSDPVSEIEQKILKEFEQYLEFFGYHLYQGLCLNNLISPAGFQLIGKFIGSVPGRFLDLSALLQPPNLFI